MNNKKQGLVVTSEMIRNKIFILCINYNKKIIKIKTKYETTFQLNEFSLIVNYKYIDLFFFRIKYISKKDTFINFFDSDSNKYFLRSKKEIKRIINEFEYFHSIQIEDEKFKEELKIYNYFN